MEIAILECAAMKKRIYAFCKVFLWMSIGSFIGRSAVEYVHYKESPLLYGPISEVWKRISVHALITLVVALILLVACFILRKENNK